MNNIDKYKDKEHRKEYIKQWKETHSAHIKEYRQMWKRLHPTYFKDRYDALRLAALKKVGHGILKCNRCGCDKYEWLEINHINGGGCKERKIENGSKFYESIVSGVRKIDDLELLCRPCNLIDAAERMSGRKYVVTIIGID